jgi:two-component system response regulator FixJ
MTHIIYVVDDDYGVRDSMRMLLEICGYTVKEFQSGSELLTSEPMKASCIVMDVNLPGESGLETLIRLRDLSVTTPVIIVTGREDDRVRREFIRLNVAFFFQKPILGDDLLDAIEAAMDRRAVG